MFSPSRQNRAAFVRGCGEHRQRALCADCMAASDFCSEQCQQQYLRKRWRFGFPMLATVFSLWLLLKLFLAWGRPWAGAGDLFFLLALCSGLAFPSLGEWLYLKLRNKVTLPGGVSWGSYLCVGMALFYGEYLRAGCSKRSTTVGCLLGVLGFALLVGIASWFGARAWYHRQAFGKTEDRKGASCVRRGCVARSGKRP